MSTQNTMKNLILIALTASVLVGCNANKDAKTELQTELLQAQHETELLKLQSELDLERAKQATIDSMQLLKNGNTITHNGVVGDSRITQRVDSDRSTTSTNAYRTTPATVQKKKGMSTPAKGAIIGAGVGAVTGAVVSKKKVQGAVIGAVVGAGAGAGTGVIIDKRKQKKAASSWTSSN